MIFKTKPLDFNKKIDVVGCYIEFGNEILLLQRNNDKANGGKWGVPAGKIDAGESVKDAAKREVFEETGINIDTQEIELVDEVFVRDGTFDLFWSAFKIKFSYKPEVIIRPEEHQNFTWIEPKNAIKNLDLIHDLPELLETNY